MSSFQAPGDVTLSEAVGKRLMTPGGSVAPGVAPELMPVLVLENDRPEYLHLTSSDRYCRTVVVAAGGAGTRSSAQLFNSSRDLLIVCERIEFVVASGNAFVRINRAATGVTPFGTSTPGTANDTRQRGDSQAVIITDSTLGLAGTSMYTNNGTTGVVDRPFILTEGNGLYISPNADNVAITLATFWWRERRLNQSERL